MSQKFVRKSEEKRTRWWVPYAGLGIWSVIELLSRTLNIRSLKEEHDSVYDSPFLVAFWHNCTLLPAFVWKQSQKKAKMCILTSASKDGALVEAICNYSGLYSVRGSSGRRGATAYRELLTQVTKENYCVTLTPDGPRGPIHSIQPGIIKMASQTGLPIIPVCFDFDSCWRIKKAWDQYIIPKPGSNVTVLWKKRIYIPANISDDEVEVYSKQLQSLLMQGKPDFPPL